MTLFNPLLDYIKNKNNEKTTKNNTYEFRFKGKIFLSVFNYFFLVSKMKE